MKTIFPKTTNFAFGVLFAAMTCGPAFAGPEGGEVIEGEGTIEQLGDLTQINQDTGRIAVNWDTFNIGETETVRFVQPDSTSVALNQILDQNPSTILGIIDANGHVFLINPNGIVFGENSQINVAGLIASTLNISTDDFMAGNYSFEAGSAGGLVLNQGEINAAGFVALLGEAVANEGLIVAEAGTIALASGDAIALDFDGSGLIYIEVQSAVLDSALGQDDAVRNSGALVADGGRVLLTASAANDVFTNAINNDGVIQARRIENEGGVIRLSGGSGTTINTGDLDASGDANSDGGSIHVTGNYVGLAGDATLNADGGHNGGQILVGGGYQGNDADVQNADRTFVGGDVTLTANAGVAGDGGQVIVWGDDVTRFYGNISATGGSNSGNGGFAEVSGLNTLGFFGMVDLSAANGAYGTLLLDPTILEVLGGDGGGVLPLDASLPLINFGDGAATDFVSAEAIEAQIADVLLQATDSIIVRDLDLNSGDGDITMTNNVSITLETRNSTVAGDGAGTIGFDDTTNSIITSGTGSITITAGTVGTAGASITSVGNLTTGGGGVSLTSAGDITVGNAINSNGGDVTITADDNVALGSGSVILSGAGNVTVRVDNADDSADTLAAQGVITSTGAVNLNGSLADANDTLQGSDSGDTWVTVGAGTGTLNGWVFNDMAVLQGGSGADGFTMGTADFGGDVNAGDGDDVITINVVTNGDINGEGGADTINLNNTVGGSVDGGDDADTVNLGATVVVTGTLTGGAGGNNDDTLAATGGGANAWNIDGTDTLNGQGFTGFENLAGEDGVADTFAIVGAGAVAGNLDGGAGGGDVFDVSGAAGAQVVDLGAGTATPIGGTFAGIESHVGNGALDTIIAPDTGVTITITAAQTDDGTIGAVAFTDFGNVTGGDGADTFDVNGTVTTSLSGGLGNDTFTLNDGGTAGTIDGNGGTDEVSYANRTAAVTVAVDTHTSIETLTGSAQSDTLEGTAAGDAFIVSAQNDGTAAGVTFTGFENLDGLGGDDSFTMNAGVDGTIAGGAGNDTILGNVAAANAFIVNLANTGTINGTSFVNVENLTGGGIADTFTLNAGLAGTASGGAGDDTFTLNDGGTAGIIDGNGGTDEVSFANRTAAVTVAVDTHTSIETLTGSAQSDTLEGTAAGDAFIVSAQNDGTAAGVTFTGFENLDGLAGDDSFTMNAGVDGLVTGGLGNDTILGNVAAANAFIVNLANTGTVNGTSFVNVENLTGGGIADTFTLNAGLTGTASGGAGDDTFTLNDGGTAGTIDGNGGTDEVSYANRTAAVTVAVDTHTSIEQLTGSAQADTLEGTALGDAFTVDSTNNGTAAGTTFTGFENLDGLGGDDTFTMNAGVDGLVAGGSGNDTVLGNIAAANTFIVTVANTGTVNGTAFANVENLTGGGLADTFTLDAALTGTASGLLGDDTFTLNDGGSAGTIDGGGGTDTATFANRTAAVTVAVDTFTSIEDLVGSAFADTLQGTAGADAFTVTALNAGTSGTVTFSEFENLDGLAGDDSFTMNAGIDGTVTGGLGNDTIIGDATAANAFAVTAADAGTVNGTAFAGVENLTGGGLADTFTLDAALTGTASGLLGDDTFTLNDGGSAGTIDGGGGMDTATFANRTAAVTVAVDTFTSIEDLVGSVFADTLQGTAGDDTFTVTAQNAGTSGTVTFSEFENLDGLAGDDSFTMNAGVDGLVTGGLGNDTILGNAAAANAFIVNLANTGTVNGTSFVNVENLTGGGIADTFTFNAGLTGTASGGAGDDTFSVNDGGSAGLYDGGAGTADTVTYAGSTGPINISLTEFTNIEVLTGSADAGDTLNGTLGADTFTTTGSNDGTANGIGFTNIENLAGLAGADTFTLNGLLVSGFIDAGNGDDIINMGVGQQVAGGIIGGAGNDTLNGSTANDIFVVNAADAGTINLQAFSGIENLNGAAGADTFAFDAALTGDADGGIGDDLFQINDGGSAGAIDGEAGSDEVSYANLSVGVTVAVNTHANIETITGSAFADTLLGTVGADGFTVSTQNNGDVDGLVFASFETLDGQSGDDTFTMNAGVDGVVDGGLGNDMIVGDDAIANVFNVNLSNTGNVNGSSFINVENLTGGSQNDSFNFNASITGTASGLGGADTFLLNDGGSAGDIDGGAGIDQVSYAGRTAGVTVALDAHTSIEDLVGSAQMDTLTGTAGVDNFTVNGTNSGVSGTTTFSDFENLDGLGGDDTFTMNAGVDGIVSGGSGDDTIIGNAAAANTFVVNLANTGTVNGTSFINVENLTGGASADIFNLSANLTGSALGMDGDDTFFVNDNGSAGQIDGGAGNDTQSYTNRTSSIDIGVETLINMEFLVGTGFDDMIRLAGDVDNDLTVDGGAGSDTFSVEALGGTVDGNLTVNNVDDVLIDAGLTVNGAALTINSGTTITQGIGLGMLTADALVTTSVGDQTFTDTDVVSVDATITGGGDFDMTNDGAMTADVTTAGGDIDILNTGGDLTLDELFACTTGTCSDGAGDGVITLTTTNGNILGVAGMDHIMGGSAFLISAFGIGEFNSVIRFVDMPTTGTPIRLIFSTAAYIDAGSSPVEATENLFNVPEIAELVAAAQAAGREEDEDVDWAAYDEDITVYEINNEGIQLPEDQQIDEFAMLNDEETVVPIAHNHGRR